MKFMSEFELHQLTRLFGTAVGVTWTGLFARPFLFACFCVWGAKGRRIFRSILRNRRQTFQLH